ncbi:hypothetical protein FACS1894211_11080 [Clostridia bacterium]|nr:hypothetical protein FACS1894211_11080 [Clostridia bacterium]
MGFARFTNDAEASAYTTVSNVFIAEYLPYAPDMCVKVYLYGLHLCVRPDVAENDLDRIAAALAVEPADLINIYGYWQELGLVHILKQDPPTVCYLPVRGGMTALRRVKPEKYADFNLQLQDMTAGRMITQHEYNEYYNTMETLNIEPEAMLLTARYCLTLKGGALNYAYILTVARNWAAEGIRTAADVERRLGDYSLAGASLAEVLKALKSKKKPDFEDYRLYLKWTQKLDFKQEDILYCAKTLKGKGSLERLSERLDDFYSKRLTTAADMEKYISERDNLFDLAKKITKILGVYYEDLDYVIDTYVLDWTKKGFSESALTSLADFLFRRDFRRLSKMHKTVDELYGKGLTEEQAIAAYLERAYPPSAAGGTGAAGKAKNKPFIDQAHAEAAATHVFNDPDKDEM